MGQAVKEAMPLAMRNLAIAQQQDRERYRLGRSGGWDRPKASFKAGYYVLVERKTKHTVDVPAGPHIIRVMEVKNSGGALLEGSDAAKIGEQLKNIALNPLPILDHNLYPERFYRGATMHCIVVWAPMWAPLYGTLRPVYIHGVDIYSCAVHFGWDGRALIHKKSRKPLHASL